MDRPRIGLVVTLVAGVGLVAIEWVRRRAIPHWARAQQADAELYGFLEERLHGTEDLRANGAVAYTMRRLLAQLQHSYAAFLRVRPYNVGGLMVPIFVFGIAYAAVFLLGDWLHRTQGITIGTVYLVVHYLGLLSGPLWQIVNEVQDLQTAGASVARVQGLLATTSQVQETRQRDTSAAATIHNSQFSPLESGPLALTFDNVSVRYTDADNFALHDVTFTLPAGETLGLLGRTGSGKTTLTRLLLRLVDPKAGTIRLGEDGLEIRQLPLRELRHHVGMVTQEVQLFHATVRDNLTFFDETVTDETLWTIAEQLGLADWLAALPAGLDTQLGSGGQGLSAGQAQLVAFLRIGLQDPGLVLLDEPSSRLDPLTERLLDRAIGWLLAERTGIIIAHRLETVARVDKILVLAEGQVVEFGERAVLMAEKGSHYAGLLVAEELTVNTTVL
ncbi:MAG: ABC transporter ATP-binding protein [Caldilineaceae bacterium]